MNHVSVYYKVDKPIQYGHVLPEAVNSAFALTLEPTRHGKF